MSQPVRLQKKVDNVSPVIKLFDMIEAWVNAHAFICLSVLFVFAFLISLFVVLVYANIGVSATDSGVVYNQFNNIV